MKVTARQDIGRQQEESNEKLLNKKKEKRNMILELAFNQESLC